ncbi:MFS general substrate transporter [Thelephora terrestris]|uniref:MFS general substrate transporter n=1 Tax=Thelephora terrestris TaxID=56493 RepID=A0A9P6L8Y0_9AGAM|nr:MFS general substrate transporter [Thelephora terrestris]
MTLTSGIEQQTARSLAIVHHVPPQPPHPSIELRRVKHPRTESGIKDVSGVQGDEWGGTPAIGDQTQEVPPRARKWLEVQYACLCFALFLAGWNDGTSGPLIPRIQRYYNVNLTIVSLIFIANCVGFVTGAAANVILTYKVGFGKLMVIGPIFQAIAYSIQAPAPPFPLFVLAPILNGFGMAIQDAQANGYVASLDNHKEVRMGILHAVYGLGAFSAPLVSTQFSTMRHWSFHYLSSMGIAVTSAVLAVVVFRFQTQEECLLEIGQHTEEVEPGEHGAYHQIFRLRAVHLMAFFILIYVGVEVTIGGWIVTYIIQVRGGGPSSGYVSSGFFGGLTFGRVALLWVNNKIGERRAIFLYSLLVLGLEVVIWRVPSLIGNAVAVSIVGVLLGPIYPIVMNHAARILPNLLLTGSIGWIAGLGQAGSALIPFTTGALAASSGIWTLHPLLIGMIGLLIVLWALVPGKRRAD